MTGQQLVPLPQAETWAALNDTQVLKECVPGCESLEKVSETQYELTMRQRIGGDLMGVLNPVERSTMKES